MNRGRSTGGRRWVALGALLLGAALLACGGGQGRPDDGSAPDATGGATTAASGPSPTALPTTPPTTAPGTGSTGRAPTSSPTTAPGSPTSPSASASSTPNIEGPPFVGAAETVSIGFPGTNPMATLTAVRVGRQTGYVRVVFEFEADDALPGVLVRPQPLPVTQDPSDLELTVGGDRALVVRMQAASRARLDDAGLLQLAYDGPLEVSGDGATVVDVVWAGDFEALLSWAIGIDGPHRYRAFTLTGPPRVVIDIATERTP